MPTLSSNIVKHKVASVRDVEEALSRQAVYGGDLATNLLELAAVSERDLTRMLAESYGLEPAPVGELPTAVERVRRLVSGELALRHGTYPLEERGGILALAVSEPLPPEVENDLSFSLGAMIEQRIAPLVRIREAIARDYGMPLDRRTERVLARLAGKPDPNPSFLPPGQVDSRLSPRPPTSDPPSPPAPEAALAPEPRPQPQPRPSPAQIAPTLASAAAPRVSIAPDLSSLAKPGKARKRPRRLGPYTPAMAEKDLIAAQSRDDVLRAFFDFAAQYFEYSALFAIHGDLAEGRDAAGSGASRARVIALGVPLDLPGALSRVVQSPSFELVRLDGGGLDGALAKDLERRPGPAVLLLPVRVRGRCVLVLYGDHGDSDVELEAIGEVISFVPLVSQALEHLIVKKKLMGRGMSLPPLPVQQRSKRPALPGVEARAAALAGVLDSKAPAAPARAQPVRAEPVLQPPPVRPQPSPAVPVSHGVSAAASWPPTPQVQPPSPPPPAAQASPPAPQAQSSPPAPVAHMPSPSPPAPSPVPPRPQPKSDRLPFQRTVAISSHPPPAAPSEPPPPPRSPFARPVISVGIPSRRPPVEAQGSQSPLPQAPSHSPVPPSRPTPAPPSSRRLELVAEPAEPDSDPAPQISHEEDDWEAGEEFREYETGEFETAAGVPLAPASRSLRHSARPPPRREDSEELNLPSVIVDLANDCRMLLERLINGDTQAGDKLVQVGGPAVTVLVAAFPGPITAEPRRSSGDGVTKASECGPVLRTLARIGVKAVPVIVVRTADGDPNVRAWATRLLGEMPTEEATRAVVRRFTDEHPDVRRAALAAGRLLQHNQDTALALHEGLADLLLDAKRPEEQRHTMIEALADLRDPNGVPTLIRLLQDPSRDIVRSAHWALVVVTHQDFSTTAAMWDEWWRQNGQRHRIEWLIDALMHDSQEIRRAAGDELKALTKEYFGYYDDLPVKERLRAQERYREWWGTKGKARFR